MANTNDSLNRRVSDPSFFESEAYGAHWGHIPLRDMPKHEPEVIAAKRRFERIAHPVCHVIVDVRA